MPLLKNINVLGSLIGIGEVENTLEQTVKEF